MDQVSWNCFGETFGEKIYGHLNVKHLDVYSLSVIFILEAALKRRPRVAEAEIN